MTHVERGSGEVRCFACGRLVEPDARVRLSAHAAGTLPVGLHQQCAVDMAAELLTAVRTGAGLPLVGRMAAVSVVPPLTRSEKRVLTLLARGDSNRDIAKALHRSESTVKNVVSSILLKLEAESRTQAAIKGLQLGLVEPPETEDR